MKKLLLTIVLLFLAPISLASEANKDCLRGVIQVDICKIATEVAHNLAENLPMKVNRNMTLYSVMAIHDSVNVTIIWNYDRNTLEESFKANNIPISVVDDLLLTSSKNLCAFDPFKAFTYFGGKILFSYIFSDGELFDVVALESCEE